MDGYAYRAQDNLSHIVLDRLCADIGQRNRTVNLPQALLRRRSAATHI